VLRRLFDVYKMFLLGLLLRWKLVIFITFKNLEIIMKIRKVWLKYSLLFGISSRIFMNYENLK
jgi:hypothetical protein